MGRIFLGIKGNVFYFAITEKLIHCYSVWVGSLAHCFSWPMVILTAFEKFKKKKKKKKKEVKMENGLLLLLICFGRFFFLIFFKKTKSFV
jgi:hypothetical protein